MVNVFRKFMLLTAFLIALVVFLAGLYAGFILDSYRVSDTKNFVFNTELDAESFVVESEFFDTFDAGSCSILNERINLLSEDLAELGNTLARHDAKRIFRGEEYNQLKRQYFLLEIRAYILRKQTEESCAGETSNVVLFFYETRNNQDSLNQGYALDYIVERYGDTVVFSFDKDFDDSALRTLMEFYNVTDAPTMVINFEEKVEGYLPQHEIRKYLE